MSTVRAVTDPEVDPKAGKPRPKSEVSFPYFDLDKSIEVVKIMRERAGGVCDLPQLAALLGYSGVRNGSFRMRVSAAKMFGLIEDADDQKLRVSSRGTRIASPVSTTQASKARADAFLAVELFKKVFDEFNGQNLPEEVGIRNLIQNEYGVVPDRVIPTVRVMLDSAEQAGFFRAVGNRSRMVKPLDATTVTPETPPPPTPPGVPPADVRHNGGSGGGGGDGSGIDPAILGLLRRLPPGGTALTTKRRTALIEAFTATVNFIYPDADESEPPQADRLEDEA